MSDTDMATVELGMTALMLMLLLGDRVSGVWPTDDATDADTATSILDQEFAVARVYPGCNTRVRLFVGCACRDACSHESGLVRQSLSQVDRGGTYPVELCTATQNFGAHLPLAEIFSTCFLLLLRSSFE